MKFEDALKLIPTHLPSNECWEYRGFLNQDGYGQYTDYFDGRTHTRRAHREMFKHSCEPLSKGELVRHTCDNRACCNPAHLVKGTQQENMRDCIERGRFKSNAGENNSRAVLTEALVSDIRKIYSSGMWSYSLLGQLFGVHKTTIAYLIRGETWPAC